LHLISQQISCLKNSQWTRITYKIHINSLIFFLALMSIVLLSALHAATVVRCDHMREACAYASTVAHASRLKSMHALSLVHLLEQSVSERQCKDFLPRLRARRSSMLQRGKSRAGKTAHGKTTSVQYMGKAAHGKGSAESEGPIRGRDWSPDFKRFPVV
jgi:hypothetical protein